MGREILVKQPVQKQEPPKEVREPTVKPQVRKQETESEKVKVTTATVEKVKERRHKMDDSGSVSSALPIVAMATGLSLAGAALTYWGMNMAVDLAIRGVIVLGGLGIIAFGLYEFYSAAKELRN